jgi:hypothetical protein
MIAAWRLDLDRILRALKVRPVDHSQSLLSGRLQTELVTHTIVVTSDIHHDVVNTHTVVSDGNSDISSTQVIVSEVHTSITNTHTIVSDLPCAVAESREGSDDKNQSVSVVTHTLLITEQTLIVGSWT